MMMGSSSVRKEYEPGEECAEETNRLGVCGDPDGCRDSRRPGRMAEATVEVMSGLLWSSHLAASTPQSR